MIPVTEGGVPSPIIGMLAVLIRVRALLAASHSTKGLELDAPGPVSAASRGTYSAYYETVHWVGSALRLRLDLNIRFNID
jgi:hypothetical protein